MITYFPIWHHKTQFCLLIQSTSLLPWLPGPSPERIQFSTPRTSLENRKKHQKGFEWVAFGTFAYLIALALICILLPTHFWHLVPNWRNPPPIESWAENHHLWIVPSWQWRDRKWCTCNSKNGFATLIAFSIGGEILPDEGSYANERIWVRVCDT